MKRLVEEPESGVRLREANKKYEDDEDVQYLTEDQSNCFSSLLSSLSPLVLLSLLPSSLPSFPSHTERKRLIQQQDKEFEQSLARDKSKAEMEKKKKEREQQRERERQQYV